MVVWCCFVPTLYLIILKCTLHALWCKLLVTQDPSLPCLDSQKWVNCSVIHFSTGQLCLPSSHALYAFLSEYCEVEDWNGSCLAYLIIWEWFYQSKRLIIFNAPNVMALFYKSKISSQHFPRGLRRKFLHPYFKYEKIPARLISVAKMCVKEQPVICFPCTICFLYPAPPTYKLYGIMWGVHITQDY